MNIRTSRRAFTLIELLIAVGLGVALCAAAFATVRSCGQAFTVVNRLSIENRLLRTGVGAALDELDLWTSYDDEKIPYSETDPTNPLRAPGRPFHRVDLSGGTLDLAVGQHDPRAWWRGCGPYLNDDRFGDYAIHSRITHPDPVRRWYPTTIRTLIDRLGYFALLDYMPAGTLYAYYDEYGDLPKEFDNTFTYDGRFYGSPGAGVHIARDVGGTTHGSVYVITRDPAYLAQDVDRHHFYKWTHVNPPAQWNVKAFLEDGTQALDLLPLKPAHWPGIAIETWHMYSSARQYANASINVASPITGQRFRLHLSATSTTLRGARRQRGLDAGTGP